MKAIILAGGIGKRMQPIQKDKCLLKFLGKELILHKIGQLERAGIRAFIIVCNPTSLAKVKELVGDKAEYVVQQEAKGMADALLAIKNPPKEALIVGTSDLVDDKAYTDVLRKEGDSVLLGYRTEHYLPVGYLATEGDKIKGIIEKPGAGNEPSDMVNIVVHYHRDFPRLVKSMRETKSDKDDVYERAMDKLMKETDFRVVPYEGKWVPIKYPWHVLDAAEFFLGNVKRSISPGAKISDKAVIEGDVVIEDGVRVFENAVIRGPCYIGKNSIVGNNALIVGGSHIGDNCAIGFSSEIKHSYFGDSAWSHQNYVGDSIIMDGCNLGAGTRTANWRFDGQPVKVKIGDEQLSTGKDKFGCIMGENSKTGINVSLMPGVKIGPNSIVGAHLMVAEDVGPGRFVLLKQSVEEKENKLKDVGSKKELMKKPKGNL
jgi:bifunctional UDP-N-acetylglucosamine pyrophosphorylase/glucosamine-1-phosphate N-acetyltransferase